MISHFLTAGCGIHARRVQLFLRMRSECHLSCRFFILSDARLRLDYLVSSHALSRSPADINGQSWTKVYNILKKKLKLNDFSN